MKKEDITNKTEAQLQKLLSEKRLELEKVSREILQKKEKNVKKAGLARKEVARILTVLKANAMKEKAQ